MQAKRVHLQIFGRVQGVFYRAHTQKEAQRFNLTGWVKNRSDGSVELVAEGPEEGLGQLIGWCNAGPPAACVTGVNTIWEEATGEFDSFRIRYS